MSTSITADRPSWHGCADDTGTGRGGWNGKPISHPMKSGAGGSGMATHPATSRRRRGAAPRPGAGPKTAEGIERIRRAATKHGRYSKRAKAEPAEYRNLMRACRDMLAGLSCNRTGAPPRRGGDCPTASGPAFFPANLPSSNNCFRVGAHLAKRARKRRGVYRGL
jgi:hypothetical protein